MKRLTRSERTARTRESVLEAADTLLRRKGLHGTTLDEIADEAGFSKGVIYSQFGSKDELILALIEQRVGARVTRMVERVRRAPDGAVFEDLWEQARSDRQSDLPWALLYLEFRVHAARNPKLNRRYAELHARALRDGAAMFEALASKLKLRLPYEAADFARFVAALDSGGVLEAAVEGPGRAYDLSRDALQSLLQASNAKVAKKERKPR